MTIKYLLDTNIVSALMKASDGPVAHRARQIPPDALANSINVAGELRFGAARKGSPRLIQQVEEALETLAVLSLDAVADAAYARIRFELERAGTPISSNDMWIAAHALALDCVLVTANEREFRCVPGLRIENWIG
jgi:tRNA(fMet)-specific endonuclease VapC